MGLKDRIIKDLIKRRDKILNGEINCIPLPFDHFRSEWTGIEQGRYHLISGSTKSGKTQLANFLFVYNTVLYSYYNPDIIYPKIFYYPLEETPEAITLRFMAFLISHITKGKVKISPTDLRSTDERRPLSNDILDIMKSEDFCNIMEEYEKIVEFRQSSNPTGIWKDMSAYAKANGTTHTKTLKYEEIDELGQKKEVVREMFDYYEPNVPNEYIFIIVDHVSLLSPEKGKDLRETIMKLSEYMVILRNRYNYIPVIVQQQSIETQSLDAFKSNKIRPTIAGLGDSKYTGRDCNIMLGITNPNAYELPTYLNYDIATLKNNFRVMEVVINRDGNANGLCPLFFEGAINNFKELPPPNSAKMIEIYTYLKKLIKKTTSLFSWSKLLTKYKYYGK